MMMIPVLRVMISTDIKSDELSEKRINKKISI